MSTAITHSLLLPPIPGKCLLADAEYPVHIFDFGESVNHSLAYPHTKTDASRFNKSGSTSPSPLCEPRSTELRTRCSAFCHNSLCDVLMRETYCQCSVPCLASTHICCRTSTSSLRSISCRLCCLDSASNMTSLLLSQPR